MIYVYFPLMINSLYVVDVATLNYNIDMVWVKRSSNIATKQQLFEHVFTIHSKRKFFQDIVTSDPGEDG